MLLDKTSSKVLKGR